MASTYVLRVHLYVRRCSVYGQCLCEKPYPFGRWYPVVDKSGGVMIREVGFESWLHSVTFGKYLISLVLFPS